MLQCAIVGLGGLGQVHLDNMRKIEKETQSAAVRAIFDVNPDRFSKKITTNLGADDQALDLSNYSCYTHLDEMLEKEKLDFIISAVPTFVHEEIAIKALQHGVHTFSEKPMALSVDACERMLQAAKDSGKLLMIGHCLRYWPAYKILKDIIDSGKYGKVVKAQFTRFSPLPAWSHGNWMTDYNKSGCAVMDLHIHDTDMVQWLFGVPDSVTSWATHNRTRFDSISTIYGYSDKVVSGIADWGMYGKYQFNMGFLVRLEQAVVEYADNCLKIYTDTEEIKPDLSGPDAYQAEIEDFIRCIETGSAIEINPPEASVMSVRIVQAEVASAESGKTVAL